MTCRRQLCAITVLWLCATALGNDATADVSRIRVPDGFAVERVAGPPLVDYPMMAGFDERGRLFVAENAGVNVDFKQLEKDPPNKVLRLEDTNGDGVFDERTVFADKLTFPSGALWHQGALYVCSPPGLWKFTDSNDDGVADTREQIVTGFGSTGNAADLHGPFLGPEGWLYFCDGRNGHDLTLGDGAKWKGKAACVYRCKPDGTGLEVVFGGGFDNPVEVAFTPEGEPLVNVNLVHATPHRVDAILYGIEGSNYPHADAWRELKRTGEFQPSVGDLGWVATSGFMRYSGNSLGEKHAGRYFSTEFNTRKVRSHVVERDGAGFRVTHEDFLTTDLPDFRPTDVLEDPRDGSLLVIDTGGWFRIGCPNSQIAKPEVRGAIYRVRWQGAPASAAHENAAVDERVRSLRTASLTQDSRVAGTALAGLKDPNLAVRRESATALGRLRSREAVPALLDAADDAGGDRFLQHAITFALIRIADRGATAADLQHRKPAARCAALIALDQMDGGNLTAELVTPHLASGDPILRDAALSIATSHPQWADQVAPTIRASLAQAVDGKDASTLRAAITAFAHAPSVQSVVADVLGAEATSPANRLLLLQVAGESGIVRMPDAWVEPVRQSLLNADGDVVAQAIVVIRACGGDRFDADLARIARDAGRPIELRVAALAALLPHAKAIDAADFELLIAELAPDRPPLSRLSAAQALAAAPLDEGQLARLAEIAARVGPIELPALLPAFERSGNPAVGAALVKSLDASKSLKSLTPGALTRALAKYPPEVQKSAAGLIAKINPGAAAQQAWLAEFEPLLAGGSASRGQSVFFGKTAACASCHAVRGSGAHVGPDLSKIAAIRTGRDLLESVVFPSASFARGYESYVVQTRAGQTHAGTLAAETADAVVLRTPAEVRVPRASVKTIRQDRVSIMPQGLEANLSREELADLMAFLQSLR